MATSDRGGKDGMEEGHAGDLSYSFSWVLDTGCFLMYALNKYLFRALSVSGEMTVNRTDSLFFGANFWCLEIDNKHD